MVDYQTKKSSGIAKAGLATAIAVGGATLLSGGVPLLRGPGAVGFSGDPTGGYVTDKEMSLIRENSGKDAVIAQLTAEKYADEAIREYNRTEVEPLKTRVCNLEADARVNVNNDRWTMRYMNSEFVHQPKASIQKSIVVCKQCGCNPCDCHGGA